MRRPRTKPLPPGVAALRYKRLRVAFALEGDAGGPKKFAAEAGITLESVSHCLNGKIEKGRNFPRRSLRLEQFADDYIARTFARYGHVLDLNNGEAA